MLIAVNAEADLRAGFTAARYELHGNGYADIDVRDAIRLGPSTARGIRFRRWARMGRGASHPANRRTRWPARPSLGWRRRAAARADWARRGLDQTVPDRRVSFKPPGRPASRDHPLPVLQALIDETHRLGKKGRLPCPWR